MNRDIKTERLYKLGEYQNIKFEDSMRDIPAELAVNNDFMNNVRLLQLLEMEGAYRRYIKLLERIGNIPIEEAISLIAEEKNNTLVKISEYIPEEK